MTDNKPGIGFFKSGIYDTARDSYSPEITEEIKKHFSAEHPMTIAEFGAGSGAFTKIILQSGLTIQKLFIVDPDIKALGKHRENFKEYPQSAIFEYIQGSSEHSLLPDAAVDGVFAAQCFHWFKIRESRMEFMRILKPFAKVFLTGKFPAPYNTDTCDFIALTRFGKRLYNRKENIEAFSEDSIREFFGKPAEKKTICKEAYLKNLDQLKSEMQIRIDSSGDGKIIAGGSEIIKKTETFFYNHQKDGFIELIWETFSFCGEIT